MTIIFKAKTGEAYHLKVLAELLTNNLKTGCFELHKDGIALRQMDAHRRCLVDLNLQSENFSLYKYKRNSRMFVGINLNHFHKMLKSVKKKDSLELFIDSEEETDLGIKAIPKENSRITTSYVKIQNIQNLDIDLPEGYRKPVIVPSTEIQKMFKDMFAIGNIVEVKVKGVHISFKCDAGGILKRTVEFGEIDDDDDMDEEVVTYKQDFSTDQLARITKVSGLGSHMKIFAAPNLPLLFKSRVGNMGEISIYIKSKKQIESEHNQ